MSFFLWSTDDLCTGWYRLSFILFLSRTLVLFVFLSFLQYFYFA